MDARIVRIAVCLSALACSSAALGATYSTPNFVVTAPTDEIAQQCALVAEECRERVAIEWLGKTLPRWYRPCTVSVKVGQIGAGGKTEFSFDRGEVFGWRMSVQGTLERILDSVIPHEVSHTIFACHFRRPLPRWADEGAATLVEHESEQNRQRLMLKQVMNNGHRIPLKKLLAMKEYPTDMEGVLTLYAEGYSLADFLVQAGGRTRYLDFLEDAHHRGWDTAIREHYKVEGIDDLEHRWNGWIMAGSPSLAQPEGQQLAAARPNDSQKTFQQDEEIVVRGQSSEEPQAELNAEQKTANADWNTTNNRRLTRPQPLGSWRAPNTAQNPQQTQNEPGAQEPPFARSLRGSETPPDSGNRTRPGTMSASPYSP